VPRSRNAPMNDFQFFCLHLSDTMPPPAGLVGGPILLSWRLAGCYSAASSGSFHAARIESTPVALRCATNS
jgi:hypothetical protein